MTDIIKKSLKRVKRAPSPLSHTGMSSFHWRREDDRLAHFLSLPRQTAATNQLRCRTAAADLPLGTLKMAEETPQTLKETETFTDGGGIRTCSLLSVLCEMKEFCRTASL